MPASRAQLIERKHALIAEIEQARRELARLEAGTAPRSRLNELNTRLNALMAEEHRLRLAIDRAPRGSTQELT